MRARFALVAGVLTFASVSAAGVFPDRTISGVVRRIDQAVIYVQTESGTEIVPKAVLPKGIEPRSEEWIKFELSVGNESKVRRVPARAGQGAGLPLRMW